MSYLPSAGLATGFALVVPLAPRLRARRRLMAVMAIFALLPFQFVDSCQSLG